MLFVQGFPSVQGLRLLTFNPDSRGKMMALLALFGIGFFASGFLHTWQRSLL